VGDDKGNGIYMVETPPMVFVDDMVQRETPNAKAAVSRRGIAAAQITLK
jgi:hypothetical protein